MEMNRPRFKPLYQVEHVPEVGTFLLTEILPTVLNGRLNQLVAPLIDGSRSVDDIAAALVGKASASEVYYALDLLEERGYVEESVDDGPVAEAALWQALGVDARTALDRLARNPVSVADFGDPQGAAAMRDALAQARIRNSEDATIRVAVVSHYRDPRLKDFSEHARNRGWVWLPVKPMGTLSWFGPLFEPDAPGCWRCLAERVRMNYPVDSFVEEQRPQGPPLTSRAALPTTTRLACDHVAFELARYIVGTGETDLASSVIALNHLALQTTRHRLIPRPQCELCGDPGDRLCVSTRTPSPVRLQSRKRLVTVDGSHRTVQPEETLERYAHFVSPITGIVSRLERISPPEHPVVHAYSASHNWATHPDSLAFIKRSLRSQSGGKGKTDAQAKVGALAEACERYSGVFRGDEIRRRASFREMGSDAIHPNECMLFSDAQFLRRDEINAEGNSFQMVPFPFDPDAQTDWSPLWSVTQRTFRWLPTAYLYYSYSKSVPKSTPNRLAAYADSNGCAAGNTLEEAALQALLELAERDSVASWWYNRVRRPEVDLDDLDDQYLVELRQYLKTIGRDLWVLDLTNDLGVPVFAAFSKLVGRPGEQIVVGFGAHLDPRIGAMRAITEVNQFFASLHALKENELEKAFDPGAIEWWNTATCANQGYIVPDRTMGIRSMSSFPDLTSEDLREEVLTLVKLFEAQALEVLLLDQTRADVGFPVIKAVVPGLRHFWSRLAPGRLFSVPVKLGWLPAPLDERALNPVPVFF